MQYWRYILKLYTAFKYLCNLAGTDYKLPEDDAMALKHVMAV